MNKIDKWLSLSGIIGALAILAVLWLLGIFQPISLFILLLITFLFYFFRGDAILNLYQEDRGSPPEFLRKFPRIHVAITFLMALLALALILASEDVIKRPVWIFGGIALCGTLIFIQLILKIYKFPGGELALFTQALIFLTCLSMSSIVTFPYNGGDTWAHLQNAQAMVQLQSLSGVAGAYRNYPLFPTLIGIFSLITGAQIDLSSRLIVMIMAVASVVLLYSLAKSYYGSAQRSLLVILLLAGSKWFIYWSTLVVSMSTAMFLFVGFYVLLSSRLFIKNEILKTVLLFFVAGISPFFHPVGSVAIIVLSASFWLIDLVFFNKDKLIRERSLLFLVVFIIVITITQWIYYGQTFEYAITSLVVAIFQDTPNSVGLGTSLSEPLTYTLDNLNFYIVLCLALVETLRQIRLRQDRLSLYSGLSGLLFIAFGYSTQVINLQAVLPYRWMLFGTILLIVPASSILVSLVRTRFAIKDVLLVACFAAAVFLGFANKDVNRDHPFYGLQYSERYEISFPEYAGLKFIDDHQDGFVMPMRVDARLWDYLKLHVNNPDLGHWNKITLPPTNLILSLREVYYSYRTAFVGDSIDQLNLDAVQLDQIYDSGQLQWLDWVPSPLKSSSGK